ncbi:Segregation and condensation protein B [Dissulfuribacter thermophilus]|uniref:Segregation and condensation protein B n=1 Tax=Dissulfuribacter thermophilus TaxID=1156395 RepID=A0A1B9F3C5_9BACT|nr:SMC-Scp complex subunit ScpB [Dissulfuribacter thermophilus]OCC14363.1 Segregation and condensation protein B [Dissulfuribacter thermophilus]
MSNYSLEAIIEALLFAKGEVLSFNDLATILKSRDPQITNEQIRQAFSSLSRNLESQNRGIELIEVKGGFRLQTKPELKDWIQEIRHLEAPRLSKASIETLSIIAYKQPITKAELEEIRGVDSSAPLRFLLEKGLIRISGRKECPGRPLLYRTSGKFLELFGLKDLRDLPKPKEA